MTTPLLELDRVTKRFGQVVIAEDLSLVVGPGDTVGIVGPNGAGKTSLFGLISGDLAPNAGAVRFAGRTVTKLDPAGRCRLGLGPRGQRSRRVGQRRVPAAGVLGDRVVVGHPDRPGLPAPHADLAG